MTHLDPVRGVGALWRHIPRLVRSLLRKRSLYIDLDAELDDEIRAHLEMATEEYEARGMSPEEARRAARRDFGGVDQVKERHREVRGSRWRDGFGRDLRSSVRSLVKRPSLALLVVFTLGIGIGATAAVFSLVQGVLLTPPAYDDPDRLVLVTPVSREAPARRTTEWTAEQWARWQEESELFDAIGAYTWTFNFLVSTEGSESLEGMRVTPGYFGATGLEPFIGRVFDEAESGVGGPPAVILGYELWMRRFDGNPSIVGQPVRISRQEASPIVVGVMPPGIRFLPSPNTSQEPNYDVHALVDFWTPGGPRLEEREDEIWSVVGRLGDGASLEAARAEIERLTVEQARTDPEYEGLGVEVRTVSEVANRDGRRILLPLFGAAVLVLLIACGNAGALLLFRGLRRQHEYGVRKALGADRRALLRLVTVESLVLGLAGAVVGVLLALGIVEGFKMIGGQAIPRLDAVALGWPVLAFGLGCALVAAVVSGLYPAVRASTRSEAGSLKDSGTRTSAGRTERRLLAGVTSLQAALTFALLVGAGLLIRTMGHLSGMDSGYDTSQVVTMSVTTIDGDWRDFHVQALEHVSAVPGVERAAFAWGVPLTGNNWPVEIEIEGQDPEAPGERLSVPMRSVTPGYFEVLGQPIVEGRDFRSDDDPDAQGVMIVNEALAERHFPRSTPVGKRTWPFGRDGDPYRIVGVVGDARTDDLTRLPQPEVYVSMWQIGPFSKHLVVRTSGDPGPVAVDVQQVLRDLDPTVVVENLKELSEIRGESLASRRFAMQLLVGFAVVAFLLTLGGIYGVLSLSVASRRREIAIRTAVGAAKGHVVKLILREGAAVIGIGVVLGLFAAFALSRLLRSFLYGVGPTDPATLVVMGLLFTTVALVACWVPARRAAQVDPIVALREG